MRGRVMGEGFRRPARPDEIAQMRQLVRRSLAEGAWGMSAGSGYTPGRWSTTDEVVALVEEDVPTGLDGGGPVGAGLPHLAPGYHQSAILTGSGSSIFNRSTLPRR